MKTALFKVDIQRGFCPGGNLPVPNGDAIVPFVNQLRRYDVEIDSADWHPISHKSFAANHPGKKPFVDVIQLNGNEQRLWTTHCVAGTPDAEFYPTLSRTADYIVHKGMCADVENYSPFFENTEGCTQGEILDNEGKVLSYSDLVSFLKAQEITDLDVVGLATDYCVKAFVLDAIKHGFNVRLLTQGCKGVNVAKNDSDEAIKTMWKAGAEIV